MLAEYYFKIEYVKGIDNTRADTLSRKAELQGSEKPSDTMLRLNEDGKMRYNHPQLVKTHKALKSSWE